MNITFPNYSSGRMTTFSCSEVSCVYALRFVA